jgi:lysyl endopeptidase
MLYIDGGGYESRPAASRKEIRMNTFFAPRRQAGRLALTLGLGALLASTGWAKPPANETFGVQGPASAVQKAARPTPSEALSVALGTVPEVRLQAVDKDAILKEDALSQRQGLVKALRFGVGRGVQISAGDGNWYDLAGGGRLWVADIASTDALGLRLHFKNVHLPAGAELAIYSPAGAAPGVAKSGNPRLDPERNVEFHGASAEAATDFWTGSFFGERARIEYQAPAGAAGDLPFMVDSLQHYYLDPVDKVARSLVGKAAGSCENDVTCYPEWADVSHAVSGIDFVDSGGSFFCSGQLLNDNAQDFTPYFLTANHCISSQSSAQSAEFFWFYQTSACNGNPPSASSVPRSDGAVLLMTSPVSDFTLMLVTGALPDNLYWAGWTGKAVADGTDAVAVHHPAGDFKRISFGFKDDKSACYDFQGTNGLQLVRSTWTDGVTEGGSSGSGIFRADTQQLYGQLFFGPSSCSAGSEDRFDCYGSFFSTYPKIKKLLTAGSDDSSEQNDSCAKARIVRAGNLNNRIVKVNDSDWYRVLVPAHKTVTVNLSFSDGNGDIDLAAFGNCSGGDPITSSTSTDDSESIALQNVGNKPAYAYWQVYLASSTRNTYNMSVSLH